MIVSELPTGERGKPRITKNLLDALEDAQFAAARAGHEELRLTLKLAALRVCGWERQVREVAWIVEHWPLEGDAWPSPTPWFARTRREYDQQERELEAEISAFRQLRAS